MTTALTTIQHRPSQYSLNELQTIGSAFSASRMFPDISQQGQALVKILAGHEMGIAPFASMSGIHIIKGKATIGANIMAALIKGSGKYDYRIVTLSNTECEVEFFQGKESIGKSKFDMADAKAAEVLGNGTWKKFPKNMLFARAISNGMRWYCPDVTNGQTVYTPEEMGAEVDEEGNLTKAPVEVTPEPAPAKERKAIPLMAEKAAADKQALIDTENPNVKQIRNLRQNLITEAIELGMKFSDDKAAVKWFNGLAKNAADALNLNARNISEFTLDQLTAFDTKIVDLSTISVNEYNAEQQDKAAEQPAKDLWTGDAEPEVKQGEVVS